MIKKVKTIEDLADLSGLPGVYIFKDCTKGVIYVGKAKDLKKRVSSYFKTQEPDSKIQHLIKEHASIDYVQTKNETEALLLEAQLIRQFQPKYNTLLKSGSPFLYFEITSEQIPKLNLVTQQANKKSIYFGPFLYKAKTRHVFEFILRKFKLKICKLKIKQGCLDYHLGKCAGACLENFDLNDYMIRIELVKKLLSAEYDDVKKFLLEQIKSYNQQLEFEKSKNINEYMENLESIFDTLDLDYSEEEVIKFAKKTKENNQAIVFKKGLEELQVLLSLEKPPKSIDCFDISHFQGKWIVGSCIRFTEGIPDKKNFRKFKIQTLIDQNDYAALQEIVTRRYRNIEDLPDVVLIDGGKGQLNAVKDLFPQAHFISIAKREETLFSPNFRNGIILDPQTNIGALIIALRNYAHHFAIFYHKNFRGKTFLDR
ncbi:unnamed protein product [Didymodactylos carnosus]|uniref:Excinuclease ABC subunit C n=1 Tax=Didymodactylos carnosus TaxID=1234261 RepID=A0A816BCC7_9BILA|nr:unnamed protein product [Didymodactylos carnosus]CAF4489405.1 unnamed protein product [Didymodactylos carnosus]